MHLYIMSGTQTGAIDPRTIELDTIHDNSAIAFTSYNVTLEYVARRNLTLDDTFNNAVDLVTYGVTLSHIVVTPLTLTLFDNSTALETYEVELALVPFVPDNTETTDLLNEFDQTYNTTDKRQIDTLITQFKNAGVWTKFDWYGNAHWAKSEHDALLNWKFPATQTLVKVGTASWELNVGLKGVAPVISDSRYTSGWQIADGPHATATSFAFFVNITEIPVAMNGLQPIGVWKRITGGGPSTPDGAFLSLSTIANSGFAGANLMNGNGNTSFAASDGLGVWGVSHSGSSQITVRDGLTLETDTVSGTADYTDPDGMSVAGSAGLAKRSFPGTEVYWGWGSALTALEFAAIEAAYQTALLPPIVIIDALFVDDDEDWLVVDDDDNYLQTE
jgi:hypothetical protein